jgi:hypothetical protein
MDAPKNVAFYFSVMIYVSLDGLTQELRSSDALLSNSYVNFVQNA